MTKKLSTSVILRGIPEHLFELTTINFGFRKKVLWAPSLYGTAALVKSCKQNLGTINSEIKTSK